MSVRDTRRQAALERMADHVLAAGLRGASLRPLAQAAGTSNRMLLYYFSNKDELLAAVIAHIAARLIKVLNASWPAAKPVPYEKLLKGIFQAMQGPEMKPYMQLWLELTAIASRGEEPILTVAGQIADGFLAWAAERLTVPTEAASFFVTMEGLLVLNSVGRGSLAASALKVKSTPKQQR